MFDDDVFVDWNVVFEFLSEEQCLSNDVYGDRDHVQDHYSGVELLLLG